DKNPAAVQHLVDSLVKAAAILKDQPDKAVPHIEAALGKGIVPTETIRAALASKATHFEIDPRKIIAPAKEQQAYQVKLGSLDKEVPFDGLFATDYYVKATAK
ncbi:hypothetical protein KC220_21630, partial [Mycobacterium tuberculosis]|nr:hypothetical protein [Mycobacterium tuberculosis]